MSIIFNTIPVGIRTNTHHIEFDSSRAVQGVNRKQQKILVMGIQLSTGTVAQLTPKQILSGDQADGYFGVGSQLAEMCRAAKKANSFTEMWAIGVVALAGGVAGTKTLTITGPATADGALHIYVYGAYVPVVVTNGDAQNTIATAVNTAIQAHSAYGRMPFTTAVATNVITFTSRWKGVDVADVRLNYNTSDANPAGVTAVVAAGVAGVGNPDVQTLLDAAGDVWYDTIICPWTDATNLTALELELNDRFSGTVQKDAVAFCAVAGSHATAVTLGTSRNNPHVCIMATNTSPTPPWIWAAVVGAVDAFEPDPARPRQTLPLPGVLPAQPPAVWTWQQRNLLLYDGIATHVVDDGGNVTIERLITTYRTNAQAVPDTAYLDVETLRTLSAMRFDRRSGVSLAFPRCKLAKSGAVIPPGQPMVTPDTIRAHGLSQFKTWQSLGWVEDYEQFSNEYVVEIDPSDPNRVNEQMGPNLINQFRGLSSQMQFLL